MLLDPTIETRTQTDTQCWQLATLQTLVERAYKKTAFYQTRLTAAGLAPHELQTLQDFAKIPCMQSEDIAAEHPYGLLTIPASGIARFQQIPGSSAAIGLTRQDLMRQTEALARSLVACQVLPGSVLLTLPTADGDSSHIDVQQAAELLGISVVTPAALQAKEIIKTILDYNVTVLLAAPDLLLAMMELITSHGFAASDLPLCQLLCPTACCPPPLRTQLEQTFQLPLYQLYGYAPISPLGIGYECSEKTGLHIHEDQFYAEIIDPETQQLCVDSHYGELVLTTISRDGMPLLRCRTNQRATLDRTPCRCGRHTVRLQFDTMDESCFAAQSAHVTR